MSHRVCVATGNPETADWMIVDKAPTPQSLVDQRLYSGNEGKFLWGIAKKAGLDRSTAYCTAVSMVQPTLKSGKPSAAQMAQESARLDAELASFKGRVLVLAGAIPLERILGATGGVVDNAGYLFRPGSAMKVQRTRQVGDGFYKSSRCCANSTRVDKKSPPVCEYDCILCKGRGWKFQKGIDIKTRSVKMWEAPVLPPNVEWIIPIFDPEGVMNTNYATAPAFSKQLHRVGRAVRDELRVIDVPRYGTRPIAPPKGATVTIDLETVGRDNDAITDVSMAWYEEHRELRDSENSCWEEVVCWTAPWGAEARAAVESVWDDPTATIECHNISFDEPRIEDALGRPMAGKRMCTMWEAQVLFPDSPKGLEKVAPMHADVTPWKKLTDRSGLYSAKDSYVQCVVGRSQKRMLVASDQVAVMDRINAMIPVLVNMSRQGCLIDQTRLADWREQQLTVLAESQIDWPWPDVDYNSPLQVGKLLYGRLGLTPQFNKNRNWSADAVAIGACVRELKARGVGEDDERMIGVRGVLKLREASDNVEIYCNLTLEGDGCVHPQFMPTDREETKPDGTTEKNRGQGARTGRIQPRRPNASNLHTDARKLWIPDPGYALVCVDYSQGEGHIEAAESEDPRMLEALSWEGGIPGYIIAQFAELFEMEVGRVEAKGTFYGSRNMAAPRTITGLLRRSGNPDATDARSAEIQDTIYRLFDKWTRWRLRTIAESKAQRYVREALGRRYPLYGPTYRMSGPKIIGYKPQACLGSILTDVMPGVHAACQRFGSRGRLWLTVHDECIGHVVAGRADEAGVAMQAEMERTYDEVAPGFRIPTNVAVGREGESWGHIVERCKG